jgi:hypothetical protein
MSNENLRRPGAVVLAFAASGYLAGVAGAGLDLEGSAMTKVGWVCGLLAAALVSLTRDKLAKLSVRGRRITWILAVAAIGAGLILGVSGV